MRLPRGHYELVQLLCAVMGALDYFDAVVCLSALKGALEVSQPEISNTDQGSQFTSNEFNDKLEQAVTKSDVLEFTTTPT